MICPNPLCGRQLPDDVNFCAYCGLSTRFDDHYQEAVNRAAAPEQVGKLVVKLIKFRHSFDMNVMLGNKADEDRIWNLLLPTVLEEIDRFEREERLKLVEPSLGFHLLTTEPVSSLSGFFFSVAARMQQEDRPAKVTGARLSFRKIL